MDAFAVLLIVLVCVFSRISGCTLRTFTWICTVAHTAHWSYNSFLLDRMDRGSVLAPGCSFCAWMFWLDHTALWFTHARAPRTHLRLPHAPFLRSRSRLLDRTFHVHTDLAHTTVTHRTPLHCTFTRSHTAPFTRTRCLSTGYTYTFTSGLPTDRFSAPRFTLSPFCTFVYCLCLDRSGHLDRALDISVRTLDRLLVTSFSHTFVYLVLDHSLFQFFRFIVCVHSLVHSLDGHLWFVCSSGFRFRFIFFSVLRYTVFTHLVCVLRILTFVRSRTLVFSFCTGRSGSHVSFWFSADGLRPHVLFRVQFWSRMHVLSVLLAVPSSLRSDHSHSSAHIVSFVLRSFFLCLSWIFRGLAGPPFFFARALDLSFADHSFLSDRSLSAHFLVPPGHVFSRLRTGWFARSWISFGSDRGFRSRTRGSRSLHGSLLVAFSHAHVFVHTRLPRCVYVCLTFVFFHLHTSRSARTVASLHSLDHSLVLTFTFCAGHVFVTRLAISRTLDLSRSWIWSGLDSFALTAHFGRVFALGWSRGLGSGSLTAFWITPHFLVCARRSLFLAVCVHALGSRIFSHNTLGSHSHATLFWTRHAYLALDRTRGSRSHKHRSRFALMVCEQMVCVRFSLRFTDLHSFSRSFRASWIVCTRSRGSHLTHLDHALRSLPFCLDRIAYSFHGLWSWILHWIGSDLTPRAYSLLDAVTFTHVFVFCVYVFCSPRMVRTLIGSHSFAARIAGSCTLGCLSCVLRFASGSRLSFLFASLVCLTRVLSRISVLRFSHWLSGCCGSCLEKRLASTRGSFLAQFTRFAWIAVYSSPRRSFAVLHTRTHSCTLHLFSHTRTSFCTRLPRIVLRFVLTFSHVLWSWIVLRHGSWLRAVLFFCGFLHSRSRSLDPLVHTALSFSLDRLRLPHVCLVAFTIRIVLTLSRSAFLRTWSRGSPHLFSPGSDLTRCVSRISLCARSSHSDQFYRIAVFSRSPSFIVHRMVRSPFASLFCVCVGLHSSAFSRSRLRTLTRADRFAPGSSFVVCRLHFAWFTFTSGSFCTFAVTTLCTPAFTAVLDAVAHAGSFIISWLHLMHFPAVAFGYALVTLLHLARLLPLHMDHAHGSPLTLWIAHAFTPRVLYAHAVPWICLTLHTLHTLTTRSAVYLVGLPHALTAPHLFCLSRTPGSRSRSASGSGSRFACTHYARMVLVRSA